MVRGTRRFDRPVLATITEHTVRYETDLEQVEYQWRLAGEVHRTERFFLVKLAGQFVLMLPRRALTPEQDAEFDAFLGRLAPAR
ncbi:YcxB family protein [Amycolatopsis cihanbeyliensis]|uniref:YcxB-like protein n=1 Tax=Amycolatopsis cihanbeyliensis TaxID=1128664 RepID=A0A542DKM9_AMYCI|nr:YcxB family protein [Amycolatopsis cihanbeyliensis]TQJ03651.1 YcxB-like protein [Amycolatopsis cihanbeyliensis]